MIRASFVSNASKEQPAQNQSVKKLKLKPIPPRSKSCEPASSADQWAAPPPSVRLDDCLDRFLQPPRAMSNKRLGLGFNPKHYTDDNITQTVMKALWVPGPVATITNAAAVKTHVDKIGPESNDEVVSKTIAETRSDSAAGANRFAVVGLGVAEAAHGDTYFAASDECKTRIDELVF